VSAASTIFAGFKSFLCNAIASSSKASCALFHSVSLLIWRFSVLECLNCIILASDELILWIATLWLVLHSWMWVLIFKTFLVSLRSLFLVVFPVDVIVLVEVPSVISLNVRKNDRFGLPFVVVLFLRLRQSVVVVREAYIGYCL